MKKVKYFFPSYLIIFILIISCNSEDKGTQNKEAGEPAFCDCVNHDYHNEGDKEKCDKIEAELKQKLESASKEERGEILMQIKDCKVQGQYDND